MRRNRCWVDTATGPRFFDRVSLATLLAEETLGQVGELPPAPDICCNERVSVATSFDEDGDPLTWEGTWTKTPPILAHDGQWKVAVYLHHKGTVFVPHKHVDVLRLRKSPKE